MTKIGRPPERFCKRGHDTDEVGRIRHGYCRECAGMKDRGELPTKPGQTHDPDWERARVTRWNQIVADDPVPTHTGAVNRVKEFELRYQKLEADLPTPVDA